MSATEANLKWFRLLASDIGAWADFGALTIAEVVESQRELRETLALVEAVTS